MPHGTAPAEVLEDRAGLPKRTWRNAKARPGAGDDACMSSGPVTVHVVHTRGAPDRPLIRDRLVRAIAQADIGRVVVVTRCLTTLREACEQDLHGSPTILIDDRDPFTDLTEPCGVHSRSFVTELGVEPAPSVRQLVSELRRAYDIKIGHAQ